MILNEFQKILQIGNRNLLLLVVFLAIALGTHIPLPHSVLSAFNLTTPFVAVIFITQGINIDFSHTRSLKSYLGILFAGTILAVVVYPAAAYVFTKVFQLEANIALGFILICCFPNSLEAAMAMSMSAQGDRITAVVLLVGLCLVGIVSIPLNILVWVGGTEAISAGAVFMKVITFVFLPILIGQAIRYLYPALPRRAHHLMHYVPIFCLAGLVYISCSREAEAIRAIPLGEITHVLFPSATLHILILIGAALIGHNLLHLHKADNRSFIFITSEKPMSLSVALWSVTYATGHPTSIFPILIFYLTQMVIDSFIISQMRLRDESHQHTGT